MEIAEFLGEIKTPLTILHVFSVVLGMGGALISDLFFSFFSKDKKLNTTEIYTLSLLSSIVFYALILIFLSGLAIFLSDMEKYLDSSKFLAKMTILVVLLGNGYLLNTLVWPHLLNKKFFVARSERSIRKIAFASGAVSVVSWLSVFILGSMSSLSMNYTSIIGLYLLIASFSIIVSLAIEKKELN